MQSRRIRLFLLLIALVLLPCLAEPMKAIGWQLERPAGWEGPFLKHPALGLDVTIVFAQHAKPNGVSLPDVEEAKQRMIGLPVEAEGKLKVQGRAAYYFDFTNPIEKVKVREVMVESKDPNRFYRISVEAPPKSFKKGLKAFQQVLDAIVFTD